MIHAEQFHLLTVQSVIYLANPENFSQSSVLSTILPSYATRYDGDVQAFALPGEIPPEIPRVILQSKPPQWQLRASPARIDSIWSLGDLDNDEPDNVIAQCAEVLENYVRGAKALIDRVALVISRFSIVENPTNELIEHFCNDRARTGPLRGSQMFELHNHKVYRPDSIGLQVNSWVRCKSGAIVPTKTPIISVEQDLNTLEEERTNNAFSADDLHAYFEHATEEVDGILRVYFPEEAG
jgi:hypothetical protein